ncbi:ATP-binding protein [Martelella soudanensis]|uniref:ATP-binding protein n=1 Tax=unclassified Martelella TaxID=2629616 RepID=UPI0015E02EB6|nr:MULTISPECIES: YhaN family protein [unclassified Martelella]
MRFLSLDLIRYGHFTDRAIAFRPDAGLHVVYGPNEAGKSSALAAFSDLLFGFPDRNVGYDFMHPARDLRLGATLRAREGGELAFRRRKGRSNTLLDASTEAALNDDALSVFLGSLDRAVFERAFGLDSARLRAGADEMLADGGEIGQMLFSAASGLTGLRSASEALATEADGIYAPRKSQNRSFYQALDRYDEARKVERERQLNASDWTALLKEERDIEQAFAVVEDRQSQRARRIGELERLQRLRGLLGEIDGHGAALAEFSDIDAIDDSIGEELGDLETRRVRLVEQIEAKEARQTDGRRELEALVVDDALMARRAEIGRLQAESGLYEQAIEIMPRRQHELRDTEAKLHDAAVQLGFSSIDVLEKTFPNKLLRSEFEAVVEQMREQGRTRRAAENALLENRETLARLEQQHGEGHLRDPAPLRKSYEALRDDLAGIREAETLEAEIAGKERVLHEQAGSLRPAVTDILFLRGGDLPAEAALKAARDDIASAKSALADCDNGLAKIDEECRRLEALLTEDREAGPVPTRTAIDAARAERDRLFETLSGDGRTDAYADAVRAADRLADNALDDAERVARHADNLRRLERETVQRQQGAEKREAALLAVAQAQADYEALFSGLDIAPAAPEAMIEWCRRAEALLEARTALLSLKDRKVVLDRNNEALRAALVKLAENLGTDTSLPLGALARDVNTSLDRLGERWAEAREHAGALKAARQAIEKGQEQLALLQAGEKAVAARFAASLAGVGLPGETGLAGAEAALALWADLPSLLATRTRLAREVEADGKRITAFEGEARKLAEAVAADIAGEPATRIVKVLAERAADHAERAVKRATLRESAERLRLELEADTLERARVDSRIAAIASTLPAGVVIDGLSARLRQRALLRQALAEARHRFSGIGDGASVEDIRALAETLDEIDCRQELEHLKADAEEDKAEIEALRERRTALRHRKQALEAGEGSETAAFDRVSAEAEAQALARQWVVLKLAGRLLDSALERYREGRADPILAAAGRHFKTLTRDSFEGLSQAYGEHDALVLSAVRAGGGEVQVEGLSDGTRDQLYLALRLAFLEDYASRNEPAPLIVDDIFQTFDDARGAAGLNALAGLAGLQTILFTHETSMVDIARRELGESADIITLERS